MRVSSILDQFNGIIDYDTDTESEKATVIYDDQKLDIDALYLDLKKAGFGIEAVEINVPE